jgi:hypothetical protein
VERITKIVKRGWYLLGLIRDYIICSIQQKLKVLPENNKSIVVTLDEENLYRDNDGDGRYAYLFLNRFSESGYNVYFYKHVSLMGYVGLRKYGRLIYSIGNLKFISKPPARTETVIYAFDSVREDLLSHHWKKLTYVNLLRPSFCQVGEKLNIPYFFHPNIYQLNQHKNLEHLRKNIRKIRIFFGGNACENYINNQYHDLRIYNQIPRFDAIQAILDTNTKIKTVKKVNEFYDFLNNHNNDYSNECYLLQTDMLSHANTKDWFETVSKSDFFLCLSGIELPMCHNTIEAMAVGTIPILGYPDWFFPSLEHGKNAIIYSGKEDLRKKLNEVFTMSSKEIKEMQKNVIEYYQKNLTPESFFVHYEALGSVNTVMMHPRLICREKENKRGEQLLSNLKNFIGLWKRPKGTQTSLDLMVHKD